MANVIRVCLVGAGRAGQVHAESLVQHIPDGKLVALVDPNPAASRRLALSPESKRALVLSSKRSTALPSKPLSLPRRLSRTGD